MKGEPNNHSGDPNASLRDLPETCAAYFPVSRTETQTKWADVNFMSTEIFGFICEWDDYTADEIEANQKEEYKALMSSDEDNKMKELLKSKLEKNIDYLKDYSLEASYVYSQTKSNFNFDDFDNPIKLGVNTIDLKGDSKEKDNSCLNIYSKRDENNNIVNIIFATVKEHNGNNYFKVIKYLKSDAVNSNIKMISGFIKKYDIESDKKKISKEFIDLNDKIKNYSLFYLIAKNKTDVESEREYIEDN